MRISWGGGSPEPAEYSAQPGAAVARRVSPARRSLVATPRAPAGHPRTPWQRPLPTVRGLLEDGALRPDSPSVTLARQSGRRAPCRSHHSRRARARVFFSPHLLSISWSCDSRFSPERKRRECGLDQERSSPCFPHNLNRRASACGPGRKPAPQPPPTPSGREGAAVPGGAGGRSTAGYPQPFQTRSWKAPRLITVYPRVFHRGPFSPRPPWSPAHSPPTAAARAGSGREPNSNPLFVHRR